MDDLALANKRLAEAGVKGQGRFTIDGAAEYRFLVPLRDGRRVAFASRVLPRIEVSGAVGKKLKRGLKKMAKSRAFKKLVKASMFVAPFAAAPGMLISGVGAAKRAAKKAPAKKAAAPAVKRAPPPKRAAAPKPKPAAKRAPPPKRAAAPKPKPAAKRAPPPKRAAAPKPKPAAKPAVAPRLAPMPPTQAEEALAMEVDPETNMAVEPETMDVEPEADPLEPSAELEPSDDTSEDASEDASDDSGEEVTEESVVEEVGALLRASDRELAAAGVEARSRWVNGRCEYQYLVPLADGRKVSFSATMQPTVEIGAGKIAKKIKKGIKKVAKSKAFGKVLGGLGKLASIVPIPGASTLGKGLDLAAKAQKAAQKGKKLLKGAKGALKGKAKKPAGKPAAAARAAALRTAVRPKPALPPTRPLSANKGTLVQLPSGRKALVTFVTTT